MTAVREATSVPAARATRRWRQLLLTIEFVSLRAQVHCHSINCSCRTMATRRSTAYGSSTPRPKASSTEGNGARSHGRLDIHRCLFSRDSFKRSFKRSGSTSRRGSFRKIDRTPSQEQVNESEPRTSNHSLTNNNLTVAAGPNLNGILDTHFIDTSAETNEPTLPADIDDDDDDDDPRVECIETVDGILQDIRVYQIYLLGMSGTGKCSLIRQFKTTEYRGIYEYSSSLGKRTAVVGRIFPLVCSKFNERKERRRQFPSGDACAVR